MASKACLICSELYQVSVNGVMMPMRAAVSHSAARNAVEQQVPSKCFFASPKHWQRLVHQSRVVVRSKQANDTEAAITLDGPLLGAVTIIGLSGTIAVSGASLCEIRLFNLFQWNQADIVFALNINSALLLLEALLFAPTYSIPPALAAAPSDGSSQSSNATQQQLVDIIAVRAASITSVDSWLLMLSLCRAMLRKPLTEKLPKQVILGLMLARETSKELLQRGFVLTALARWLTDRLYEAGLDDVITLSPGGLELTLPQLGFWAASLAATLLFAPAAFTAAQEAAESVSGALLLRTDVGQAVAAASSGRSRSSKEGSSSSSSSDSSSRTSSNAFTHQGHAAADAEQQGKEDVNSQESEEDQVDPDVLEYRLLKVTEECVGSAATRIAYGVILAKELARIMLANVGFVATNGNLAATWTCSVLLNAMLLVYWAAAAQQQGVKGSNK